VYLTSKPVSSLCESASRRPPTGGGWWSIRVILAHLRGPLRRGGVWALVTLVATLTVVPMGGAQDRLRVHPRFAPQERPASLDALVASLAGDLETVQTLAPVALAFDERIRVPIEVVRGRCYAVAGWSATIDDLDVWVWDGARLVAQDVELDSWPLARWCADRTATVEVEWVAFEGTGVAEGVLLGSPSHADADGPRDELSNRLDRAIARTAPRFVALGGQHRSAFRSAGSSRSVVRTLPGCCHAIVGVGESFVEDFDLRLLDDQAHERAADRSLGAHPALLYCPDRSAAPEVVVEATLLRGFGGVAFRVLVEPGCPLRPPSSASEPGPRR
jgi:hypothetical protein